MTSNIYFKKRTRSLNHKVFLRTWLLIGGVVSLFSSVAFGQTGPYFYGKPDPVTKVPVPPSPATDFYTLGADEGLVKFLEKDNDVISAAFLKDLSAALKEGKNRSNDLGYGTNVADLQVVEEDADVFAVFTIDGATNRNTLGYFLYMGDISPSNLNAPNPLFPGKTYLESRRIVFSNASAVNSKGKMVAGNKVKLIGDKPNGKFSKDVKIVWFIVSNGWDGNQVGNGKTILYTNPALNPGGLKQAAVLDFTSVQDRTVLTFEDNTRSGYSDHDFNDIIFSVTNVTGAKPTFYPNCAGQFVLTKAEYDKLPKDSAGKLICPIPTPVTNLSLTAVCSDDPTQQLKWKVTNPNADTIPYHWIITDGVTNAIKLQSSGILLAPTGDSYIFSTTVSGGNYMTLLIESTVQTNADRVSANTVACEKPVVVPPLNCCAVFPSEVTSYQPGTDRSGNALPNERKNAANALGISGPASSFVALGFTAGTPTADASLVLKFTKPVRGFINVYETTFGPTLANFIEIADVYGSLDGNIFYKIGTANNQEVNSVDIHRTTLELKGDYAVIQYLKIVDITPKGTMAADADGFDLEAVCASDFALETVVIDPNAQPGTVKADKDRIKANQAKRKNGTPVWSSNPNLHTDSTCVAAGLCDPEGIDRSNTNSILARDAAFFSLGLGGSIEIAFKEPVSGSLILFERTGDPKPTYPNASLNYIEKVAIYVKTAECNEWGDPIGYADNQGPQLGSVDASFDHQTYKAIISLGGRTIQYVKLVDVTPIDKSTSSDGYDLDFIASTTNSSSPADGDQVGGTELINSEATNAGMRLSTFPNPSTGTLTLDFGYRESGYVPTDPTIITVTDFTGRVVLNVVREADNTAEINLDLSKQNNGLYFVSVKSGSTVLNEKIFLQR